MLQNNCLKNFKSMLKNGYVDKSKIVNYINTHVLTCNKCVLLSMPHGFGKTTVTYTLAVYYQNKVDTKEIFSKLKISTIPNFDEYLNKFNVIHIDMEDYIVDGDDGSLYLENFRKKLYEQLKIEYPEAELDLNEAHICDLFRSVYCSYGNIVLLMDNWDTILKLYPNNKELEDDYFHLLGYMFKCSQNSIIFALVYLTGDFPQKALRQQTLLNNFWQYRMSGAYPAVDGFGFNENDVKELCEKSHIDFKEIEDYCNIYSFREERHFSPTQILKVIQRAPGYQTQALKDHQKIIDKFINLDIKGLKYTFKWLVDNGEIRTDFLKVITKYTISSLQDCEDAVFYLIDVGVLSYDDGAWKLCFSSPQIRVYVSQHLDPNYVLKCKDPFGGFSFYF
ncbi:MAG: AAA family ATPase [Succinivibrio sp.]|nr:AAA family ATPase [Succinivibrio sp.]